MTNEVRIHLVNEEEVGPQLDITFPEAVEVKYNGRVLWLNVDGVCRLRICRSKEITFDLPGFTQREVEG